MGAFYNTLDITIDNIPALWDQFLLEFENQFQDTQKADCIYNKLEGLRMRFLYIDQYIIRVQRIGISS